MPATASDHRICSASRLLVWSTVVLVLAGTTAFLWNRFVVPFQDNRESIRRLQSVIDRLAEIRPAEFTRDEWSYIIGWTENALGNCCSHPDFILDREAFMEFCSEAERRVDTESAIETIEWMWDEFEIVSRYGPEYSARHRPTTPERLAEASRVRIGPPVK